jgi:hypothetical protein
MTNNYIVPEAPADALVEVPGVGVFLNDKSECVSEHPHAEDQVPPYTELEDEVEDVEPLDVDELLSLPPPPVEDEPETPTDDVTDTGGGE